MKKDCFLQRMPRIAATVFMTVMLLAGAPVVNAAEEKLDDRWQFKIIPYIWLPDITGSMKLEPSPGFGSGNLDTGPGDYLENLDFAAMLDFQVQKGKWTFLADIIYLDFSDRGTAQFPGILPGSDGWTTGADWGLQALVFGFAGGYTIFQDERLNFGLLAGVRYAGVEGAASLNITGPLPDWVRSRTFSDTQSYVDPIIGFRGNFELGKKWYLPYYFDIGGFGVDSDVTLQTFAGIGYRFSDLFSLLLGYRYLYYDFGDDSTLVKAVKFYGTTLGFGFSF